MQATQSIPFTGLGGLHGTVLSRTADRVELVLHDGRRVTVPSDLLQRRGDGSLHVPLGASDFEQAGSAFQGQVVLPVVQEEVEIGARRVQTGTVRVSTRTTQREEAVDLTTVREEAEVRRVPVNKVVDAVPEVRREGDTMILPVMEEVLVVQKRLVLKEEIHVRTVRHETHDPRRIPLRGQEVVVERIPLGSAQDSR